MKSIVKIRRGFTLTEMLVVILIIAVIATLSLVAVSRARESARKSASANNLRQCGVAITSFVADNGGYLPASRSSKGIYWPQIIWPHLESLDAFMIPKSPNKPMTAGSNEGYFPMADSSAKNPQDQPIRWNYTINGGAPKLPFAELADDGKALPGIGNGISRPFMQLTDPGRTVMLAEGTSWWLNSEAKPNSNRIRRWSNGTANILWCDGSLQLLNPKTELRAEHFWAKR
jgi:prepilin-type N-terminal cleavage/methylation domain-containing protein/prepilin-type processing-associated H-X9-DG protein